MTKNATVADTATSCTRSTFHVHSRKSSLIKCLRTIRILGRKNAGARVMRNSGAKPGKAGLHLAERSREDRKRGNPHQKGRIAVMSIRG